jgi:lactate dehydrogenase-like 2-hydroxyacid dehydrogenase
MKRGASLVNRPRGKICDRDAVFRALNIGQLADYAGDAWFPQPPPNLGENHYQLRLQRGWNHGTLGTLGLRIVRSDEFDSQLS